MLVNSFLQWPSTYNLEMSKRDSSCSIIDDNTNAQLILTSKKNVRVTAMNLKPFTQYRLIYVNGDSCNKDVEVRCLGSKQSTNRGSLKVFGTMVYQPLFENNKTDSFMVVPLKDVDCCNKKFKSWNPEDYLFLKQNI